MASNAMILLGLASKGTPLLSIISSSVKTCHPGVLSCPAPSLIYETLPQFCHSIVKVGYFKNLINIVYN
jgi:hypothetical protein